MSKHIAIVLAAGKGNRMQSSTPKQFMTIHGHPLLFYSLDVFQKSFIDEILVVTSEDSIDYVQNEIVLKYQFTKVKSVIQGGAERYNSVWAALKELENSTCDYVYIHDGARPCIDEELLERLSVSLVSNHACITGVPVKDTIKEVNEKGYVTATPKRSSLWAVQTPQCFSYPIIKKAYQEMINTVSSGEYSSKEITDDAMVLENFSDERVQIVLGSYNNVKVTTPEDISLVEKLLENISDKKLENNIKMC